MPDEDETEVVDPQEEAPPAETETDESVVDVTRRHSDPSLEDQLAALLAKKDAAEQDQVDTHLTELEKLLEDVAAAQKAYEDEQKALTKTQNDLKSEYDTIKSALEAALGTSGPSINNIKSALQARFDEKDDAKTALAVAQKALAEAEAEAAQMAEDGVLKTAIAELDLWRKPVDNIKKRHKAVESVLEEVKGLRNNQKRAQAYWRLALGETHGLPGMTFGDKALKATPKILSWDKIREQIREKWNAVAEARKAEAAVALKLTKAQAAAKKAEAALATIEKALVKNITGDLDAL